MTLINLKEISYSIESLSLDILTDINLRISEGDFSIIKGPSGSGKTTLLHMCGALLIPTKGTANIFGLKVSIENLLTIRSKIGFVFQTPTLIEHLTVKDNFSILGQWMGSKKKKAEEKGFQLLKKFGLTDYIEQTPNRMSIGERQRIALILPMLKEPKMILMDEPLGSIDYSTRKIIIDHVKIMKEEGTTFIIVTHDSSMDNLANELFYLKDGEIIN